MNEWPFKLLYDGECPICSREVAWLRRRDRRGRLSFEDITAPGFDPTRYGATREELLGSIYGVLPDGRIVKKVEVFRQAYGAVGLGWLVAPTGWPGLSWIFDKLYMLFARHRMSLSRRLGRSCSSGACAAGHEAPKDHTSSPGKPSCRRAS